MSRWGAAWSFCFRCMFVSVEAAIPVFQVASRQARLHKPGKPTPVVLGKVQERVGPALGWHPEHDRHTTMQVRNPVVYRVHSVWELPDAGLNRGNQLRRELAAEASWVRHVVLALTRGHLSREHLTGHAAITWLRIRPEEPREVGHFGAGLGGGVTL